MSEVSRRFCRRIDVALTLEKDICRMPASVWRCS